jgi:hypothetical protein
MVAGFDEFHRRVGGCDFGLVFFFPVKINHRSLFRSKKLVKRLWFRFRLRFRLRCATPDKTPDKFVSFSLCSTL